MRAADEALYAAKDMGRDRSVIYIIRRPSVASRA
jgi:hypothetical protein